MNKDRDFDGFNKLFESYYGTQNTQNEEALEERALPIITFVYQRKAYAGKVDGDIISNIKTYPDLGKTNLETLGLNSVRILGNIGPSTPEYRMFESLVSSDVAQVVTRLPLDDKEENVQQNVWVEAL